MSEETATVSCACGDYSLHGISADFAYTICVSCHALVTIGPLA